MQIISVEIQGFLAYRELAVLKMSDISIAAITGLNGVGKSSLFQAINWALYGVLRGGGDVDSVVNDYCDTAEVGVQFYDNDGTHWFVNRQRTAGGSTALHLSRLDENGEWIAEGDERIRSTQSRIVEIIGLDFGAYSSLAYIQDSRGTRFISADSNERRAILMSMVPGMEIWSQLQEEAANRSRSLLAEVARDEEMVETTRRRLSEQEAQLKNWENQLDELPTLDELDQDIQESADNIASIMSDIEAESRGGDRAELQMRARALAAERRAHNSKVNSAISDKERQITKRRELTAEIKSLREEIAVKEEQIEHFEEARDLAQGRAKEASEQLKTEDFEAKIEGILADVEIARNKLTDLQGERKSTRAALNDLQERSKVMEHQLEHGSGQCLVCESDLTPKQLNSLHDKLLDELHEAQEKLEGLDQSIESTETAIDRANKRASNARRNLNNLEKSLSADKASVQRFDEKIEAEEQGIEGLEDKIEALVSKRSGLPKIAQLEEDIEGLESTIMDESAEESDLNNRIEELDQESPLQKDLKSARVTEHGLRGQRDQVKETQAKVDTVSKDIDRGERQIEKALKEMDAKREDASTAQWVATACGPKKLPSMMISSLLEDLQDRQNEMLQRLVGATPMFVEYRQDKTRKNGNTQDVLDIMVHMDGTVRPIEACSSGERVRLTLTNMLAMIQVFNERNPKGDLIRNVFMDEPLGVVDLNVVPILLDVFRDAIQNNVIDNVLIIAHNENVIDTLPQQIHITRNAETDGTAKIEVSL